MVSLILSTTEPSQDLAKPFFFVPMDHRKKKRLILTGGLISNLLSPLLAFERLNILIK